MGFNPPAFSSTVIGTLMPFPGRATASGRQLGVVSGRRCSNR